MGVYHLMGLGLSPGAVTSPISYLAHRYQRHNPEDQELFQRSGKLVQTEEKDKNNSPPGYMHSLIIFTTKDVLEGKDEMGRPVSEELYYIDNKAGFGQTKGQKYFQLPMKDLIQNLVEREWPRFSNGSPTGNIFWCEVDRRDIVSTYERIVKVIAALKSVGGLGKEIWINLTGGNNVINFALQLAATLSGDVNLLYYVQAANLTAEKCIRYTGEDNYWVELPVIPLALSDINRAVIDFLEQNGSSDLITIHSHLSGTHWNTLQNTTPETFRKNFLETIFEHNFIDIQGHDYIIGKQWQRVKLYEEKLKKAREETQEGVSLEQLASQETWITKKGISLKK